MKKLIMSAITAVALLFGFASCAGDLHDDIINPIDLSGGYYLTGSINGWSNAASAVVAFEETETAGTYNVPFSADAAKIVFAFIPTPGSWDGQIGGDKMVGGTLPTGAKFVAEDNGFGAMNGTISGLEANGKYKLTVTALNNGTLKVDCSSNVPPVPYYLDGMYLVGSINGWGSAMTKDYLLWSPIKNEAKGILTYSIDIAATAAEEQIVLSTSDWKKKYGITTIEVGKDYVELETKENANDVGNAKITGLASGSNYRFYVQTTSEQKVFMKVEKIEEYIVKFEISGAAEGTEFYIDGNPWGSSWKGKWPITSWGGSYEESKANAPKCFATADENGKASFEEECKFIGKVGDKASYEIKVVSCASDGADPEIETDNMAFEITISKGTFLVTVNLDTANPKKSTAIVAKQ